MVPQNETWRMDASSVKPNPKFANPDWDPRVRPPCRDGTDSCADMAHAYGAQKHAAGTLLQTRLREPHASHAYFVVRASKPTEMVLQTLDQTWQAYNNYGAPSTYGLPALKHHRTFVDRHGFAEAVNAVRDQLPPRAYKARSALAAHLAATPYS